MDNLDIFVETKILEVFIANVTQFVLALICPISIWMFMCSHPSTRFVPAPEILSRKAIHWGIFLNIGPSASFSIQQIFQFLLIL